MGFGRTAVALVFVALFLPASLSAADPVELKWDPPAVGVPAGYMVWSGTAPGTYTLSVDVGLATAYALPSLSPGSTYYFAVQAYDADRKLGELSAAVSYTAPPAAPSNLSAVLRDGQLLDLKWQAPSGTVSGYRIEVGTAAGQIDVTTIATGTATTYTISSLPAGTFYIRVRSVNGGAVSAPSNEVTSTIVGVTGAPSGLTATVRDGQYIDLKWQAPSGTVSGYRIEVGTASGQSDVTTIATGTATTYTVNNSTAGTYYIRVRSVSATGVSAPSNEVVLTVAGLPAPPSNFSGSVRKQRIVDLAWAQSSGASSYRVEVGTSPGQSNVRSVTTTPTKLTIEDLPDGAYYMRARAVNTVGVSAPSNEVLVKVGQGNGGGGGGGGGKGPKNLSAAVSDTNSIDLAWEADDASDALADVAPAADARSYSVEVGTETGAADVGTATTGSTRFKTPPLSPNTYYIRVRSVTGAAVSAASNEVVVAVGQGKGKKGPKQLSATLRDSNVVDLTWVGGDDQASSYRVEVGTAAGGTDVSSFTTGNTSSFSIGQLPPNRYYIRVRSANGVNFSEPTNEVIVVIGGVGGTDAPRNLSAGVTDSNALRATWEAPNDSTGVTGYLIEAGTGPGRTDVGIIPTNGLSFVNPQLPNGTYFLRVRAVKGTGPGAASNEVVVQVGAAQIPTQIPSQLPSPTSAQTPTPTQSMCTQPPSAPQFMANVIGSVVELSWSPGVGAAPTGYVLDAGSAPGRRDIATMVLGVDRLGLTTQVPDGTYALRLTATNACGASARGTDISVTVGGPAVTLPDAPSGLEQHVDGRTATLKWLPPPTGGATSYIIEALTADGQLLLSVDTGNPATVFTHGDVPPGLYMVRVRAANARGASAPSNLVAVVVPE